MNKEYDYVIIGAGIAGCSLAYFLKKYSKSILLIDRNSNVAFGASGAAVLFYHHFWVNQMILKI